MYEDRVARGMVLLDRARPGWAAGVDVDTLEMESCDRCLLGQVYGTYTRGFKALLAPLPADRLSRSSAFGFTLRDDEQDIDADPETVVLARFAALADAWRVAIRARLDRPPAPPPGPPRA